MVRRDGGLGLFCGAGGELASTGRGCARTHSICCRVPERGRLLCKDGLAMVGGWRGGGEHLLAVFNVALSRDRVGRSVSANRDALRDLCEQLTAQPTNLQLDTHLLETPPQSQR